MQRGADGGSIFSRNDLNYDKKSRSDKLRLEIAASVLFFGT
jgi:hypothetical protein